MLISTGNIVIGQDMMVGYDVRLRVTLTCNFNVFAYPFGNYICDMIIFPKESSSFDYVNMTSYKDVFDYDTISYEGK